MNKEQFLMQLQGHLSVLPPEEYHELMEDYEAHFAFGLQSGKNEYEIARELGDPYELAQEALRERNMTNEHIYWSNPAANPITAHSTPESRSFSSAPVVKARGGGAVHALVVSGLTLLNIITVPLIFSCWAVVIALAITAVLTIFSPLLMGLDVLVGNGFYPAKAYASVSMAGIGILLGLGSKSLLRGMPTLFRSYMNWTKRVAGGGQADEH